jgi:integrase
MAKPRAWTFTTEDGDVMLNDTYPLPDLVRDFECDAPIRATTLRGYHTGLRLFLQWLQAKNNIERPRLADLTPENATAFAANFRPQDRRAGRYTERNKLVALKALAKWLAEKRLYYEHRGDQRLSILRDVKLPPVSGMGRKPFDDREVKEIIAAIPRVATYPLRERAILTLQFSAPMRPDEVRRILLADFRERDREKRGHIVIRGSKTEAGTDRIIPLDDEAEGESATISASSDRTGPATGRRISRARSRSF